ncbi:hypothetical protein TWF696_003731 [Orbilia brochopaga]|uniref:Uncharacterized protein n=1 Tax=Orbilia brochopaga TaxID=3140254 RepID=A0AAV9V578_9PEZI
MKVSPSRLLVSRRAQASVITLAFTTLFLTFNFLSPDSRPRSSNIYTSSSARGPVAISAHSSTYVKYHEAPYALGATRRRRTFTSLSDPPGVATTGQRILLLTLADDLSSFGGSSVRATRGDGRVNRTWTFADYIARVRAQGMPASQMTLGVLTTSSAAFENYTATLLALPRAMPWSSADIIYLPSLPLYGVGKGGDEGGDEGSQRRGYRARLRNYLMSSMLDDRYAHIIWLDADVVELPQGLFARFVEVAGISERTDITPLVATGTPIDDNGDGEDADGVQPGAETESETPFPDPEADHGPSLPPKVTPVVRPAGLLTLHSETGAGRDVNRGSWRGFGHRPTALELSQILDRGRSFRGQKTWAKELSQLLPGTRDGDLVQLDVVGGSALFMRAELVREGLVFPVGSVREHENGGRETEGLCKVAGQMGWGCYALAGSWRTVHADF